MKSTTIFYPILFLGYEIFLILIIWSLTLYFSGIGRCQEIRRRVQSRSQQTRSTGQQQTNERNPRLCGGSLNSQPSNTCTTTGICSTYTCVRPSNTFNASHGANRTYGGVNSSTCGLKYGAIATASAAHGPSAIDLNNASIAYAASASDCGVWSRHDEVDQYTLGTESVTASPPISVA